MPDLTPDVTTTPNFDPGRVAIASGWLVYDVGYHTCGGSRPSQQHEHHPRPHRNPNWTPTKGN